MGIFRAYDVRGVYGEDLDEKVAESIGKAYVTLLLSKKPSNKNLFLARDNRSSSLLLKEAVSRGMRSCGFDVIDLGIVPTPLIQFALAKSDAAGGAIITASHNPPQYNGVKMYCGKMPLLTEQMEEAGRIFEANKFAVSEKQGKETKEDVVEKYIPDVLRRIKMGRKIRIVLDSGNGTCGKIAREIFEKLGCETISLFEEPDSRFPNHLPDPTKPENLRFLKEEVLKQKADLGIAFDGDGDRSVFMDENGNVLRGDDAFLIFARRIAEKEKGRKLVFVHDLRFSLAVQEELKKLGAETVLSKVGRIGLRENLEKKHAILAGEVSCHFIFRENYNFDDGIYGGAKMAEIVSFSGIPLSKMLDSIPRYSSTPEMRIHCDDEKKFVVVENVTKRLKSEYGEKLLTIDGAYLSLPDGWGSLRVSNTEPLLSMRFEGKTEKSLREIYSVFKRELATEGIKIPNLVLQ